MKKAKSYLAMIFLVFLLGYSGPIVHSAAGNVLNVPQDFPTIQAAANAASEGTLILIAPGTYKENITITGSLTLQGAGIGATILESVPNSRSSLPLDPIITAHPSAGQEITLRVRQLTVQAPQEAQRIAGVAKATGLELDSMKNLDLVIEQTAWIGLWSALSGGPVRRLEVRDSTFQQNGFVFGASNGKVLEAEEAIIERSRFIENASEAILLTGNFLNASENMIVGKLERSFGGIYFILSEGGRAKVVRNTVSLAVVGIWVDQIGRTASVMVQSNWLYANSYNLIIGPLVPASKVLSQLDVSIESNTVAGGGVGMNIRLGNTEGGKIRLRGNQIAWQRIQSLTGGFENPIDPYCPPICFVRAAKNPIFGNGVVLNAFPPHAQLKEPLRIEMSDNRIEFNENWGLALSDNPYLVTFLAPTFNCGVVEGRLAPEITGSANEFKDNAKGAICPNAYPLPPGFLK